MAIHKGKIRQLNSGGTYDYLLPETTIDMVNGLQDELDGITNKQLNTDRQLTILDDDKANKSDIYRLESEKASNSDLNSIRSEIDNIIVTPAEGISEQEIIASRIDNFGSVFQSLPTRLNSLEKLVLNGELKFAFGDWELGGIDANTGLNTNAVRRIRNSGYHRLPFNFKLTIADTYRCIIFAYNYDELNNQFVFASNLGGYKTGTLNLNGLEYDAYRFMIDTKVDVVNTNLSYVLDFERDSGIYDDEKNLKIEVEDSRRDSSGYVYPSLSKRLDAMYKALSEGVMELFFDWELGGLSATDGSETNAQRRIRTKYVNFENRATLKIAETYRFLTIGYIYNNTTQAYEFGKSLGYVTNSLILNKGEYDAYRFMIDTKVDVTNTELSSLLKIEEDIDKPANQIDRNSPLTFNDLISIGGVETSVSKVRTVRTFNCSPTTNNYTVHFETIKKVDFGKVLKFDMEAKVGNYNDSTYLTEGCGVTVEWLDDSMKTIPNVNPFVFPSQEIKHYITTDSRFAYHQFKYLIPRYASYAKIILFTNGGNTMNLRSLDVQSVNVQTTPKNRFYRFYGHQGVGKVPHNTHSAFDAVVTSGLNGTVVNCNLTSDNVMVVLHDDDIYQETGVNGLIYEMTYAQASQYVYGRFYTAIYPNERLPKMEEVLSYLSLSGVEPYIRLADTWTSSSHPAYNILFGLLKKYNLLGKVTVKGAKAQLDACYQVLGNNVRYGWIVNVERSQEELSLFATEYGEGNVFLDIKIDVISQSYVERCKDLGIPVSCWFVNNNAEVRKLAKWGVTEFCTDYLCDPIMPIY